MREVREKHHRLSRDVYRGRVIVSLTIAVQGHTPGFTDAGVISALVDMLRGAAQRYACTVVVYCFMPDHLHIVVRGDSDEADVWKTVVDFKQRSGFWLRRQPSPIVWQKDFYDHVVRRTEDLVAHIRYILNNPVRRGLVADWQAYPFKGSIGLSLADVLT